GVTNHQHRRLGFRVALVVDTATPAIAHRELTPTITPPPSASIGAAGKTHAAAKLNGEQKSTLADRLRAQVAMSPLPEPGQPISPAALVTEPTAINGVRAWTLETPQ